MPINLNLTPREKSMIRANWSEFTQYLAPPGIAWKWGKSGLSEKSKQYLKHHNLIVRDPNDEKWQTTEDLWLFIISRAGDDEIIGTNAIGQCKIPDAAVRDPKTRLLQSEAKHNGQPKRDEQQTLTGDTANSVNALQSIEHGEVNQTKDPTHSSDREQAAPHTDQAPLTAWCAADNSAIDEDLVVWDGPTVRSEIAIRTPAD
ncbi:uncharacterized protein Nmag_0378 [Natrialba magadii ATCC 43099]|uniref:Uncharacterized protein n=2 Tax=Natrialba magadii TaxID=13769 RepID=D3SXS8_NATMM|nr:uncharacterized protein Nmag_0378 [Natrialba magadii ATCC 43099]ELY33625.1 hypothetical protein C500_02295 [Natrialba magadii ATCC 43099]